MGSFKSDGRNQGPNRRRGDKGQQRGGRLRVESLEDRILLDGNPLWHPTSSNLADIRNGPMGNEGADLVNVYQNYLANKTTSQIAANFPTLQFQGNSVAVDINGFGDFKTFVTSLKNLGVQVNASSAKYALVEGYAPISALPLIAKLPQTLDAAPIYKPVTHFVGVANNEADHAMQADVARTQFGVTGAGVTVGVISDSVSQFQNGLADSVRTGDLLNNVRVLQDGPAGSTDEGRAMLENIHDIAPGASLQFATGTGGELNFANNILALSSAGSNIINDDLGYLDEPVFQDGIVAQAVNDVVAQGKSYFSAAGNTANQGYLSTFRPVSTTVGSLGAGTYMNFAPSGSAVTQLPITVSAAASTGNPAILAFQFDQPFATQQTSGSTAAPTSEVDFYVLDSGGAVVATGNNNNVATRQPLQVVQITSPGSYTVVIKVISGPNPGHVEFYNFNENVDILVSQQFGSAGGTFYPTAVGHPSALSAVGIGAVPWWAAQPYANQTPLKSEPFSSFGPVLSVFNPDGTPKASPVLVQTPVVSGPDFGNTSFFPPGGIISTANPPFPGEPSFSPNASQNLPSFFGTSSATPNVAAVAALMLQKSPSSSPAAIRGALIASALPLNGATAGTWNVQGGFGLVNAVAAINAVSQLQVVSTTPANGATVTQSPTQILVTFNQPVNIATVSNANLVFLSVPSQLSSVQIGKPVGVDSPTTPTQVAFPISFTVKPNQVASGKFAYQIAGSITSTSGKPLVTFNGSFNLADTTSPMVSNVVVNGRVIQVTFTEPMAPQTVNVNTVFLKRVDAAGNTFLLNNDPRFKFSYNQATNTATLDFSGLSQTQLPSGKYFLVILSGTPNGIGGFNPGVTDLAGNKLDGAFSGTFPSGNGMPPSDFQEFLGNLTLAAPQITSLKLLPAFDTGIAGDENTKLNGLTFIGQVAAGFPGTVSGLTVLAEFNSLHGGTNDLASAGGRGSTGSFDVQVTTDANGTFTLPAPFLPEGFNTVRLVVIGQPDAPPLPGLSSNFDHVFRIDNTPPTIVSAALAPGGATLPLTSPGTSVSGLSTLSLNVVDKSNPTFGPLSTPASVLFQAFDPTTASNISNYQLLNVTTNQDESSLINTATFTPTAADFVSAPNRTSAATPYFGRVDLTFSNGLPKGSYKLVVHTKEGNYSGVTDAAGNPLDDTTVPGVGQKDFVLFFQVQPEPVFITSVTSDQANAQGDHNLPRSYYEINPRAGDVVSAPPTSFTLDFSNPLDPTTVTNSSVQLIRSADSVTNGIGTPDGDFGTLGQSGLGSFKGSLPNPARTGKGFSVTPGTTVALANGPNGPNTRLVLSLAAGTTLAADQYRLYMPNAGAIGTTPATTVKDIYGNILDGEFLGNPAASGANDAAGNPQYEDLLPTGTYRLGMSGDGVTGGAFMAGFEVVPSGNVVYARPDYVEDPLLPATASNGSISQPYSVLAPQASAIDPALPANAKATLNNGDPNGGLNDASNFLSGFNSTYDRAGINKFARSAFYAASQLSKNGPVVIVALPGTPQRDPISGVVSQKTFVLQAPKGSDSVKNDGSGSVPFDTNMVFTAGTTLKLANASLFVQNQGSSLQALGGTGAAQRVTFTSFADDTVAGDSNNDGANTTPGGGDWGGIAFRDFAQTADGVARTDTFPVDVTLTQGPNGAKAVGGQDESLSILNFANIHYGGGAVPATQGFRYDEITLFNSRPAITNATIIGGPAGTANTDGSQATISGDFDSFREDDTARGPLVRRTTVSQASINGIWVRPLTNTGNAESTDAVVYQDNPLNLGGAKNYTFDSPLPYLFTSVLDVGTQNVTDNFGQTTNVRTRLYIQPGMLLKFEPGAGIRALTAGGSVVVGDRTYITGWDALATIDAATGLPVSVYAPLNADGTVNTNFKPNTVGDARVVFTSAFDNTATTSYFNQITQQSTTIVPAIDTLNSGGANQPQPGNVPVTSRWGRIQLETGVFGTFDEAEVRYAGANLNVPGGSNNDDGALQLTGAAVLGFIPGQGFVAQDKGTRFMITNNNFVDNANNGVSITPNGLVAGDTLRPLNSGSPFFRGNIFQRNPAGNGLLVEGNTGKGDRQIANDLVNSLWDSTDLTYILKGTVVLGPNAFFSPPSLLPPNPRTLLPEPKPSVVLTVQSALPGTLLPNGQSIPRPGESVIIKLLTDPNQPPYTEAQTRAQTISTEDYAGAGFIAGVDNGVDPTADPYFDVGVYSQMRFLGIGGNETTGQVRVPVIITSLHDDTVGTTVRGVKMFTAVDGNTTAPKAGDGGVIYFGGNGLPDYSVLDPRDGSLIDNADIRYLTRIEMQGGGVINYIDQNASNSFDFSLTGPSDDAYSQKGGAFPFGPGGALNPLTPFVQFNAEHAMTISDSNLSTFSDGGIFVHPGFGQLVIGPGTSPRSSVSGQPNLLFLVNNTIANMPIGVKMVGDPNSDASAPEPSELLALHNTFYNDPIAVILDAIALNFGTPQDLAQIHFIAMDNIFDGSTTGVIQDSGMVSGSLAQYNLFFNDGPFLSQYTGGYNAPPDVTIPNTSPVNGDPLFRDPVNGDFRLTSKSPAIDAARSELNLNPDTAPQRLIPSADTSTTLLPVVNQVLDARGGIRNQTTRVPVTFLVQFDPNRPPTDQLTLPGSTNRGFIDEWVPTLPTDPQGVPGPTTVPGTWVYKPALIPPGTAGVPGGGQRDALGYLRIDEPSRPNVGFGSLPFFDIGAYEFRTFTSPKVTGVTADVTTSTGTSSINLYKVGGIAGTNQPIQDIVFSFDHLLDPTTVNGSTVLLEASGGDGIFGNANNANDKFYNLSGKVSYNSSKNQLTINVGAAGLTLGSDEYRLFLLGNGSTVIRDPQGNALDGEDTLNDDPNNPQLPLPSGDGFPGGNFYTTFLVNSNTPTVSTGSFGLDPSADSNVVGDGVTNFNKPAFSGTITVINPTLEPLAGQTAIVDVSTLGNGVFDRLNAGTAFTDSTGHFVVTIGTDAANTGLVTNTSALPDSPYNVGPDGILVPIVGGDTVGTSQARVRIIDQSGNASNLPTDTPSQFFANHALTNMVIDTAPPKITSFSPAPNTSLTVNSSGKFAFAFTTNKNIEPTSLNSNTILVTRAGPDGKLGTADDVPVAIDANSITTTYLKSGAQGPEQVSFTVSGSIPNDLYGVTLKGAGPAITDVAGNALAGSFNGSFPSGQDNVAGVDFNPVFVLANPANAKIAYVGDPSFVTNPNAPVGDRGNPYPTITAALAAATAGNNVAVLPGVYTESITLKPFVSLFSAATTSTNTNLVHGDALQTIIRAPASGGGVANVTVQASNIPFVSGAATEVAGFSIASPLLGDPAQGGIDPQSTAFFIKNSSVLLDHDYFVDAQLGIDVRTSGVNAPTPVIQSDVVAGNVIGIRIVDNGTTSVVHPVSLYNDTIGYNTIGIQVLDAASSPVLVYVVNDIIWQNHDRTPARAGVGIQSTVPDKIVPVSNMFQGNGPSDTSPIFAGVNVGSNFVPANLKTTPDGQGNYVGNPAFVAPRDPRPGSDGPATFFLEANFDLTKGSNAIDTATQTFAPAVDFLYRGRVKIMGKGFPGTGPADVGAFEYKGTGGIAAGGAFRVASTSLSASGTSQANGVVISAAAAPASITVDFSQNVDPASVDVTDLVLSGSGVNAVGGPKVTSFKWIDAHTVQYNLSGGFNSSGTVKLTVPAGAVKSTDGTPNRAFTDTATLSPSATTTPTPTAPVTPAPAPSPTAAALPVVTPPPAASPTSPTKKNRLSRLFKKA